MHDPFRTRGEMLWTRMDSEPQSRQRETGMDPEGPGPVGPMSLGLIEGMTQLA